MPADQFICVLRHADYQQPRDVPSAWLPYPLTEAGVSQSKQAAVVISDFLGRAGLEADPVLDASHMLRAWQTAKIISDELGLGEIEEFPGLAERSVGAAANLTVDEIEAILATDPRYEVPASGWKSSTYYRLPFQGAESLAEAGRRVADHLLRRYGEMSGPGVKIVVAHGASIRHAAMHMGLLTPETVGSVSMYHASPLFFFEQGGTWQIAEGEWKQRNRGDKSDEFGPA